MVWKLRQCWSLTAVCCGCDQAVSRNAQFRVVCLPLNRMRNSNTVGLVAHENTVLPMRVH